MASGFRQPALAPGTLSAPPRGEHPDKKLGPGIDHRPFGDDEIKHAFDTFDLDSNRFVGATEIRHILDAIGEDVKDEEIDEMIRMCDTDGDGQVTYDEFHKLMTQPPPPLPPPVSADKTKKMALATQSMADKAARQLLQDRPDGGRVVPSAKAQPAAPASAQAAAKGTTSKGAGKGFGKDSRQTSIETLVRKLAGGVDKIKPSQVKKIYKRFQDIDTDGSGAIEYKEFLQALEMEDNPLSARMFDVLDSDGSGSIEVREFIVALSRYTNVAKSDKLKFAFMMFDEDDSGYIERPELLMMLRASFTVEGLSDDELEEKVDAIYEFLGLPPDTDVSYDNFIKLAQSETGLVYPMVDEPSPIKGISINAAMGAAP